MLLYLAVIALIVAVIGLSCFQNSLEEKNMNKMNSLEARIMILERNQKADKE